MLGLILGAAKMFLGSWQQRKKMAEDRYMAELKAGLHDPNKLRGLKWASFVQFSAPIWMLWFAPERASEFLQHLNMFPQWYIQVYLIINGGIWGMAVGSDVFTMIVRNYKRSSQIGGQYDPDPVDVDDTMAKISNPEH